MHSPRSNVQVTRRAQRVRFNPGSGWASGGLAEYLLYEASRRPADERGLPSPPIERTDLIREDDSCDGKACRKDYLERIALLMSSCGSSVGSSGSSDERYS